APTFRRETLGFAGCFDRQSDSFFRGGQNARRTAGGTPALQLPQCFREQLGQLCKSAAGLGLVVNRAVGDGPTMKGFVDLTLIFASPGFEGTVEPLDRLGGHALVVHGVSDVELRINGAENEV